MRCLNKLGGICSKGFTLLELVLLMSLVAIVSLGLYSNMTPTDISVDSAVLKLAHDLRFAQDRAMTTGRNHGFRTLSTTQYEIYDQSPGSPTTDPTGQGPMVINLTTDYKNVIFQGTYQIEFNSVGSPTVGGGSSIGLTNGTETKNFSVTNNTGLINLP